MAPGTEGQFLVHEQIMLGGNADLYGQIVVENATSVDGLVSENTMSGNFTLTYNTSLDSDTFIVIGWRDVRDDD